MPYVADILLVALEDGSSGLHVHTSAREDVSRRAALQCAHEGRDFDVNGGLLLQPCGDILAESVGAPDWEEGIDLCRDAYACGAREEAAQEAAHINGGACTGGHAASEAKG